jgi:hypothetical protein
VILTYEAQLQGRDPSKAPPYSVKETYAVDSLLKHPTFGTGVVHEVRGDKIEVTFSVGSKTLVHGRGGAAVERPAYRPPLAASTGPADKPMAEVEE